MYINNLFHNIDFFSAIDYIRGSEKIIITTHINPDGDAIGSSMSLYYALKDLGKAVNIIINESVCPETYKFLPQSQKIKQYNANIHNSLLYSADAIIIVDCGDLSRIKNMEYVVRQSPAKKILIDHHIDSERFADYYLSDTNAIATAEIVFALLQQAKIKITKEIADALYCAIYSDSGGFRFPKTSQRTHLIAASLIESGTKPDEIYEKIYNQNSLAKMHIRGMAMASMKSFLDEQLTFIIITKEMFSSSNCSNEDIEELSQVALSVKNTKVAIMIREYEESTELRVSLRSKDNINIQQIALKFGGGGHINAAGCRLKNMNLDEAKRVLIEDIKNIL